MLNHTCGATGGGKTGGAIGGCKRFISKLSKGFADCDGNDAATVDCCAFDSVNCLRVCVSISRLFSKPVDCEC